MAEPGAARLGARMAQTVLNRAALGAVFMTVALPLALGIGLGSGQKLGLTLGAALIAGLAAVTVAVVQPRWSYVGLAFSAGCAPFAVLPGAGLPIALLMVVMVWISAMTHPIELGPIDPVEITVLILIAASFVSLIATAVRMQDITEFTRWLVAMSVIFPLLRLPKDDLRRFGRVFVYGVGTGSVFALAMFFLDKSGSWMNHLAPFGYGNTGIIGTHLRFYQDGTTQVVRLTGTYIDPNVAGIFTLVGLTLACALLRGRQRIVYALIIGGALVITLSRSAMFSVVVAAVALLMFQKMRADKRITIIAGCIAAAASTLAVPAVADRIFDSFSASDTGTRARTAALSDFPAAMEGNWLFGKGWGIDEFTNEVAGYNANYVANSPLVSIYRGGIFVGLAFVLVLVAGAVLAHRNARKEPWESGVAGAGLVGFSLVGLQLDFPVVTNPSVTLAFVVLLTFVAADAVEPTDDSNISAPQPLPFVDKPVAPPAPPRKVNKHHA